MLASVASGKSLQHRRRRVPPDAAQTYSAQRALVAAGYWRMEQLAEISEAKVKQLHGIGPNALEQLRHALAAKGLSFANAK